MKFVISRTGSVSRLYKIAIWLEEKKLLLKLIIRKKEKNESFPKNSKTLCITNLFCKGFSWLSSIRSKVPFNKYYPDLINDFEASFYLNKHITHLISESQIGYRSMIKAKKYGAICILERTNTHILYQKKILFAEYDRLGIKPPTFSDKIIRRGCAEYAIADKIFCLSNFVKKTFIDQNIEDKKLIVINAGIDTEKLHPVPVNNEKKSTILFIGPVQIKKGAHMMLKALQKIKSQKFKLLILGKIYDEIKPFLKKSPDMDIEIIGRVPYSKIKFIMNQASFLLVPSLEDGGPKVIPEAMACGVPILASKFTQGPDFMQEGVHGFTYDYYNLDELSNKCVYLLENNKLTKEMGRNCLLLARKKFTLENYHQKWLKLVLK